MLLPENLPQETVNKGRDGTPIYYAPLGLAFLRGIAYPQLTLGVIEISSLWDERRSRHDRRNKSPNGAEWRNVSVLDSSRRI